MKDVKCYIVNKDISIFEYDNLFHVLITGESKKYYDVYQCDTIEEARSYINKINN